MWLKSTNKAFVCLFILCICYFFALLLGSMPRTTKQLARFTYYYRVIAGHTIIFIRNNPVFFYLINLFLS